MSCPTALFMHWIGPRPGPTHLWKDTFAGVVGLDEHMLAELGSVEAQCLIELGALVVVEVHGDVHGQAEELGPDLSSGTTQQLLVTLE